ncbi:MAG: tRNA-guanine transglycosylase, partial [Deltaproteobacteria bacterium]|nr:tRNA-guanine transglycosylase [Deltaproteobacteria bacterium]
CIAYPSSKNEAKVSVELTSAWAKRCKKVWNENKGAQNLLFGIIQGGMFRDLRKISAEEMVEIGFNGYAVGGLSVGEPKGIMFDIAEFTLHVLPDTKPKYVMGTGTPEDLIELVSLGADMFDCVIPTRNARNGQMFTKSGTINISNSHFRHDTDPVEEGCTCYTCRNYSRAYLRHLYMAKELLSYRLNTIHNIHYYTNLMKKIREAILNDEFETFKKNF